MPRSAHNATTLPGRFYTSPEVFHREMERLFLASWVYAGRVSSLESPGAFMLFEIDTESVIIVRGQDGGIRAFHNVCRHRGTRLCRDASGQFSRSIQCGYHAWTYGLDGELIGAPNMDEVPGFEKKDYPLLPVAVEIWEGGVYLNLAADPESFADAYGALIGKFDRWRMDQLHVVHQIEYEVHANWKLVFQNYSECYHCPALHPQLNRLTPYRDSSNDLEEGLFLGGPMRLTRPDGSMTMSGDACGLPVGPERTNDGLVHYYTIMPNMLLSLFPDYVLVHRIQPVAPDHTRIICDWLFHPDTMAGPGYHPDDAVEFWSVTNNQDWSVSELSQQGITSRAYRPGPYAELESMIAAWDRAYLKVMGETGAGTHE